MNRITVYILIFLCFSHISHAQKTKVVRDLFLWTNAGIKKDFGKKFESSIEFEYRWQNNISKTDEYFIEIGGEYDISKSLELGLGYRLIQNKKKDLRFHSEYRWNFNITCKKKFNRLKAAYRLQYQNEDEKFILHRFSGSSLHVIRNRLETDYDIPSSKFEPYLAVELFSSVEQKELNFYKIWFTTGTSFKVKKMGNIRGFYRIEHELYDNKPYINYILGLKYSFDI